MRKPQIYVRPVAYRPIRVYVGGEVSRPGYYTLTGVQSEGPQEKSALNTIAGGNSSTALFPTGYEAIRSAQGITPYTELSRVEVTRKRADGLGAQSTIAGGNSNTALFPTVYDAIRSAQGITLHGPVQDRSNTKAS